MSMNNVNLQSIHNVISNLQSIHNVIPNTTKGRLAEQLYPDTTYDHALPQTWVDAMYQRGFDNVPALFVWGYPEGQSWGVPLPLCTEALIMMAAVAANL